MVLFCKQDNLYYYQSDCIRKICKKDETDLAICTGNSNKVITVLGNIITIISNKVKVNKIINLDIPNQKPITLSICGKLVCLTYPDTLFLLKKGEIILETSVKIYPDFRVLAKNEKFILIQNNGKYRVIHLLTGIEYDNSYMNLTNNFIYPVAIKLVDDKVLTIKNEEELGVVSYHNDCQYRYCKYNSNLYFIANKSTVYCVILRVKPINIIFDEKITIVGSDDNTYIGNISGVLIHMSKVSPRLINFLC